MLSRNVCGLWAAVGAVIVVVTATQPNIAGKGDPNRLHVVQEEFLNMVGNLTSSVKDVEELMTALHSQDGRQMGRLLMEGVMLGAAQKDSATLLAEFWTQLNGRLSPEFQDKIKDYKDFFNSMDFRTLPFFLDQMFRKDEQGKSMADIPMGQLVDMVQPTASKYGVDLRAFMNSVMGKGDNNARDLIFAALDNLNMTSLLQLFTSPTNNEAKTHSDRQTDEGKMANEIITTDIDLEARETQSKAGEKNKKAKADATLRLFRPLVASLLRENKIDLDADAVLQVLAPLVNGDLTSHLAPLLAAFGSQAGGGLAPVLRNLLGGEKGTGNQAQTAGILGVMGTLLARGNNKNMDLEGMLTMASMFMNMNEKQDSKKRPSKREPDLGMLANLAGNLLQNNDVASLLKEAGTILAPNKKNDSPPNISKDNKRTKEREPEKSTRQLTDLIESLLVPMRMKLDYRRLKDSYLFVTAFFAKNADVGGFVQQATSFLSMYSMDAAKEKKIQDLKKLLASYNLANLKWSRVFEALQKEETRSNLIQTMTPTLSEFVLQLGSKESQQKIYSMAENKLQAAFAAYGLMGVTFENFPERLGPVAKQMTAAWKLPLKPSVQLKLLRDYLKGLHEWVIEGLAHMESLPSREAVHQVVAASLTKAGNRVMSVYEGVRVASPQCLPLALCHLNSGTNPYTFPTAATRAASLVLATEPSLDTDDPTLLLRVVQAASGRVKNCEEKFGRGCRPSQRAQQEDDQPYEHEEL